jgi:hypothetical protein
MTAPCLAPAMGGAPLCDLAAGHAGQHAITEDGHVFRWGPRTAPYFDAASAPIELWGDDPTQVVRLARYLRERDPMSDEDREWERLREIAEKPWKWQGEYAEMLLRPDP